MNRNYRVIRKDEPSGETSFVIYQVHYDGQDAIKRVSSDPASPSRGSMDELRNDLDRIRQALDLPVLDAEDVLNSLETSGATAYGNLIREQIGQACGETGRSDATEISHEELTHTQQRKLEEIAAAFAEKVRIDPNFGQ